MEAVFRKRLAGGDLDTVQIAQQQVHHPAGVCLAAVQRYILAHVENAVLQKAHQAGHIHFAVFRFQKLFQLVVAKRAVFYINFAHDAHLYLGHTVQRDRSKIAADHRELLFHVPRRIVAVGLHPFLAGCDPLFGHGQRVALMHLVGLALVAQRHDQIAVENAGKGLAGQLERELKAAVFFQAGKIQACHGHLRIARLHQCLAQQVDIVAGAAAAAGLGDQQRRAVQIILAAVQRIQELADHQKGRIAGVVVNIF